MSGFKTKARTVELLGRKQIRDSVTALAELMKNAYDADAPWLRVEFSTTGSNQHVVIVDTGLGTFPECIPVGAVADNQSKAGRNQVFSTLGSRTLRSDNFHSDPQPLRLPY